MSKSDDGVLIRVQDLKVAFRRRNGLIPVIDSVSFTMSHRSALGIVGESGSGKSMLCRSLIGTLGRHGAVITAGTIELEGVDITNVPESAWQRIRGSQIGLVPQSSLASLNPVLDVETQLVEAITASGHSIIPNPRKEALRLLETVRIARPERVLTQRSTELSGGMKQRIMIAAAIARRPTLLIADEPTTALDVTVQREILDLIESLRRDLGMALILVSHDQAVIEDACSNVLVMYAGAAVEYGEVDAVRATPRHPYSRALQNSRVDKLEAGAMLRAITGEPPTLGDWSHGCRFWPRCPLVAVECKHGDQPNLRVVGKQLTACIRSEFMESNFDDTAPA